MLSTITIPQNYFTILTSRNLWGINPHMPKEKGYVGVIELVSKPSGWDDNRVEFYLNPYHLLSGDLNKTSYYIPSNISTALRESFKHTQEKLGAEAFNGDKATITTYNYYKLNEKQLYISAGLSDFFTLWGMPKGSEESARLHRQAILDLKEKQKTEIPIGISTHNILLTNNDKVALAVRSSTQAFAAGKLSMSFEEQMDPDKDSTPFDAVYRGYAEEFGLYVPIQQIRLLGIACEIAYAYTCWGFVAKADIDSKNLAESWRTAPDYSEATSLLSLPLEEIDKLQQPELAPEFWKKFLIGGKINPDAILKPHPTVEWRVDLLKNYLGLA